MIKPQVDKVYILGPHVDGLYSTEVVKDVFEDGTFTAHFRGNSHLHRYNDPNGWYGDKVTVIAEVGHNATQHWWTKEELGIK